MSTRLTFHSALLLLAALAASASLYAQGRWVPTNGPDGSQLLTITRDTQGRLYAGGRDVYRSDDHGRSWTPLSLTLLDERSYSVAAGMSGKVYVRREAGSFSSIDGGESWNEERLLLGAAFHVSATTPKGTMLCMGRDTLWRLGGDSPSPTPVMVLNQDFGTGKMQRFAIVNDIVVGQDSSIILTLNDLNLIHTIDPVYRSTDDGRTWHSITQTLPDKVVSTGAIFSDGTILLYGATGAYSYRSVDTGLTWQRLSSIDRPFAINKMIVAGDGSVIASDSIAGIVRTTTRGESWDVVLPTPAGRNIVDFVNAADGSIVAATSIDGAYRSADNGVTWQRSNTGMVGSWVSRIAIAPGTDVIFAATFAENHTDDGGGIFRSTDLGTSWVRVVDVGSHIYGVAVGKNGNVFAALDTGGIYRSSDGGLTWRNASRGLHPSAYSVFSSAEGTVYAYIGGDLYISTSNGDEWRRMYLSATMGESTIIQSLSILPSRTILIPATSYGLWRKPWVGDLVRVGVELFGSDSGRVSISEVAALPSGTALVTAHTASQRTTVYRSTDDGISWHETNGRDIGRITFGNGDTIYAAGRVLHVSVDDGLTWQATTDSMPAKIGSTTMITDFDGNLYVGSRNQGLLRFDRSLSSVDDDDRAASPVTSMNITPNPTGRDVVAVTVQISERSAVRVRIVDALGRIVSEPIERVVDHGSHTIDVPIDQLGEGFHLVEVTASGTTIVEPLVIER